MNFNLHNLLHVSDCIHKVFNKIKNYTYDAEVSKTLGLNIKHFALQNYLPIVVFQLCESFVYILLLTQVHRLLRGVCGDAPEHDAGQHGAQQ